MTFQGPIHPVKLKLVTGKHLNRKYAGPGERIYGVFIAADNVIYLDKAQSLEQLKHTFLHEIKHMLDHQLNSLPVEQQCDAYATWAMSFYSKPLTDYLRI